MNFDEQMKHNLLVNVVRLYYLQHLTQQEIADKLGFSRVKVTRLLQEAVAAGIVEFKIKDPVLKTLEAQDTLAVKFGLKKAVITPAGQNDAELLDLLGQFAAVFLKEYLRNNAVIGIGFGRTLNGMLPYLNTTDTSNVKVVSLTGGLAANTSQPNPYDIASAVAKKVHGTPHYLLSPAIAESVSAKDLFMRDKNSEIVTSLWERMDICLLSIGLLSPQTGVFYSFSDPAAEVEKVKAIGGVGDLLIKPFDLNGQFIQTEFLERTIAINLETLRKTPFVVGVAGGVGKLEAIFGALRSNTLNVLVTDEKTAGALLEMGE